MKNSEHIGRFRFGSERVIAQIWGCYRCEGGLLAATTGDKKEKKKKKNQFLQNFFFPQILLYIPDIGQLLPRIVMWLHGCDPGSDHREQLQNSDPIADIILAFLVPVCFVVGAVFESLVSQTPADFIISYLRSSISPISHNDGPSSASQDTRREGKSVFEQSAEEEDERHGPGLRMPVLLVLCTDIDIWL